MDSLEWGLILVFQTMSNSSSPPSPDSDDFVVKFTDTLVKISDGRLMEDGTQAFNRVRVNVCTFPPNPHCVTRPDR